MPSKLINTKTKPIAKPSELAGIKPTPDSSASMDRIKNWTIAGSERNREGSAGNPKEMDERDKKTVAW